MADHATTTIDLTATGPAELDAQLEPGTPSGLRGPTAWLGVVRRSAIVAALLSAIVPGLGQLWAGARTRAVVIVLPFLGLLVFAAAAILVATDGSTAIDDLAGLLLQPEVLTAILVLDVVLLVYRCVAIVDAWIVARRRSGARRGGLTTAISVILLVAIVAGNVAAHAGIAYLETEVSSAGEAILGGEDPTDLLLPPDDPTLIDDPGWVPEPSPDGGVAVAVPGPLEPRRVRKRIDRLDDPPLPPPSWSVDERLDILLLGVDAGPGRWSLRTDTMILVSVDKRTGASAMFGIPRNLVNVPLPRESRAAFPGCNCYPRILNSLYVYAMSHPGQFPGGDNRGFRAVAGAIETLTGVNLDGMAIVDLNGFVKLIDALGGLRITVPRAIYDSHYPKPNGTGNVVLSIKAGRQKMNGFTALAYARSRHESSDYSRMRRQQEVLLALRKQVKPCKVLDDLPRLVKALKSTVRTTFKPRDLPDLLRLAAQMDLDRVARHSISPPTYPEYLRTSDWKRARTLVRGVFDKTRAKTAGQQADDPAFAPPTNGTEDEDPCE